MISFCRAMAGGVLGHNRVLPDYLSLLESVVFFDDFLPLGVFEFGEFGGEDGIAKRQYPDGEDGGVFCAGLSDRHACYGHAGGHLHGAEQCVEACGTFSGGKGHADYG